MVNDKVRPVAVGATRQNRWTRLVEGSAAVAFVDVCLRGCSQVLFQNNALSGLLFFLAIFWGAHVEGRLDVAIGAVVATVVSTATAYGLRMDRESLRNGLYGYNATLLGVALPTFLAEGPEMWMYLVFGAAVSAIAMVAIANVLKPWKLVALTAPFVFITWFFLLATYNFSLLPSAGLPVPAMPHALSLDSRGELTAVGFGLTSLRGIAQVFLLPSELSGVLILVGIAISSRWAAGFAALGSLLSILIAELLGAANAAVQAGLYSFSAVLTAVALGYIFNRPSWRVLVYAVLGVMFTVVVQGALATLLQPFGIPTLTMSFVLASWLFLVPNQDLMPRYRL